MESISVYGYDASMLECVLPKQAEGGKGLPVLDSTFRNRQKASGRCVLLELPVELRSEIYKYVLPRTINNGSRDICWIKGTTALLAVSKQIHEEASRLMYGTATFLINIVWDCTTFECRCILASGLTPSRAYAFPDRLSPRYLSFIHNFKINIHLCDSYFGMVKYNYSNHLGLTNGLRDQVESFCTTISIFSNVQWLHVHFQDASGTLSEADEVVLQPFLGLSSPPRFNISGDVGEETRRKFVR